MTNQEMQLKYQELATELLAKRNEIHRQKDAVTRSKARAMEDEAARYCEAKREKIEQVNRLRQKKYDFDPDDSNFHQYEEDARQVERELSMMRVEHEHALHRIGNRYAMQRCELDDEDRKATLWYEQQKTALMRQMVEQKQQEDE